MISIVIHCRVLKFQIQLIRSSWNGTFSSWPIQLSIWNLIWPHEETLAVSSGEKVSGVRFWVSKKIFNPIPICRFLGYTRNGVHYPPTAHSYLFSELVLKRNVGPYLTRRFLPSITIVAMAFLGFWVPLPIRTPLLVTSFLSIFWRVANSDIDVPYVYALQVWNIGCALFVLAAIVVYVVSLNETFGLENSEKQKEEKRRKKKARFGIEPRRLVEFGSLDYISRGLFPLIFVIFNLAFAYYCLHL